ncbi:MAG: hypothetical protein SV775_15415 [Thermodesulfobacteriota bacterium]|nr:hypothetical protein [Thermodesulfobacteriota bacterium]
MEGQEITCCVLGNQQLETLPLICEFRTSVRSRSIKMTR